MPIAFAGVTGESAPLGATPCNGGVNFSIFEPRPATLEEMRGAYLLNEITDTAVVLDQSLLFDHENAPNGMIEPASY